MVPLKLFGSSTSPYARRLRMWMVNVEYEFVDIDIFSSEGRKILKANNPALKIPMLQEEDRTIFDSRVM
jgi:glutathione S-transferase